MLGSRVEFDPAPTIASREIIPPSTKRFAIQFFSPSVGQCTVSPETVGGLGQGITLTAGMQPVTLRLDVHGEVVQRGWNALYSANATGISWIQSLH